MHFTSQYIKPVAVGIVDAFFSGLFRLWSSRPAKDKNFIPNRSAAKLNLCSFSTSFRRNFFKLSKRSSKLASYKLVCEAKRSRGDYLCHIFTISWSKQDSVSGKSMAEHLSVVMPNVFNARSWVSILSPFSWRNWRYSISISEASVLLSGDLSQNVTSERPRFSRSFLSSLENSPTNRLALLSSTVAWMRYTVLSCSSIFLHPCDLKLGPT